MSETKTEVRTSFSWLGLLGIIFVMCKIFEYGPIADWSWWLVLLPFYVGLAIIFGILAVMAIGGLIFVGAVLLFDKWERYQRSKGRLL